MKKVMAKKAPAKMTMKKSGIKKAQNGINTDKVIDSLKAQKKSTPYNVAKKMTERTEKLKKAEQEKGMKRNVENFTKSMKESGMSFNQKNGGRTKK